MFTHFDVYMKTITGNCFPRALNKYTVYRQRTYRDNITYPHCTTLILVSPLLFRCVLNWFGDWSTGSLY